VKDNLGAHQERDEPLSGGRWSFPSHRGLLSVGARCPISARCWQMWALTPGGLSTAFCSTFPPTPCIQSLRISSPAEGITLLHLLS
jgi:hypothetical protein